MSTNLKAIRDRAVGSAGQPGAVKVLVALRVSEPDASLLDRLRGLGLTIDRVIKSTVLGSVPASQMEALRGDAQVAEVEPSARLRPHEATPR